MYKNCDFSETMHWLELANRWSLQWYETHGLNKWLSWVLLIWVFWYCRWLIQWKKYNCTYIWFSLYFLYSKFGIPSESGKVISYTIHIAWLNNKNYNWHDYRLCWLRQFWESNRQVFSNLEKSNNFMLVTFFQFHMPNTKCKCDKVHILICSLPGVKIFTYLKLNSKICHLVTGHNRYKYSESTEAMKK